MRPQEMALFSGVACDPSLLCAARSPEACPFPSHATGLNGGGDAYSRLVVLPAARA